MKVFPSSFAPCKAKKSAPGCTFRESQATWRISSLLAPADRAVSTPWSNSLSFLPLSVELARAEFFRWLSTWFVAASGTCSSWLTPIFILMPDPLERVRDLWCRCSELHGDLCAPPHFRSCGRRLIRSKTAANENRFQPQSKAYRSYLPHRLSREVRHLNVASFTHGHGHPRHGTIALPGVGCRGLRGRLVGHLRKIRGCEILENRAIRYVAIPVRGLDEPRANRHIARHVKIGQHLFRNSLKYRRRHHAALVEAYRRIEGNENGHRRIANRGKSGEGSNE